jgi:hypothetical protein
MMGLWIPPPTQPPPEQGPSVPFPDQQAAGIIAEFLKNEFFPVEPEIGDDVKRLASLRLGLWGWALRGRLGGADEAHAAVRERLLAAMVKWRDVDTLLAPAAAQAPHGPGLPPGGPIATYFQFVPVVEQHFRDMLALLTYGDQLLSGLRNQADFRAAAALGLAALLVSATAVVVQALVR